MDNSQQRGNTQQAYGYADNHFGPAYNASPYSNVDMGKPHHETVESIPLEHQKSSGSFRTHPTHDEMPTEAEMSLLRKLRTLQGADYEAQYFDNKPTPNQNSQFGKMGNPTAL